MSGNVLEDNLEDWLLDYIPEEKINVELYQPALELTILSSKYLTPEKEAQTLPKSSNIFKLYDDDNIETWYSGLMKSTGYGDSLTIVSEQNLASAATVVERMSKM